MNQLDARVLFPFHSACGENVQIERVEIPPNGRMELGGYPEERLYFVQEGRGALSVYGKIGEGDLYLLRPDVALYFTPGLLHEMVNTGEFPMHLILFRITGGLVPAGAMEGVQKWTAIGTSQEVGCGFWYTDIFNLQENETAREGINLQLWGIGMRRAQKLEFAELLTENPGGEIRRHSHANTHEYYYFIQGEAELYIGDRCVSVHAGSTAAVPANEVHYLKNKGDTQLMWIDINVRAEKA